MRLKVKLSVGRTTLIVNPLSELERGGTKGQFNRVCNQLSEQSLGSHLTWLPRVYSLRNEHSSTCKLSRQYH